MRQKPASRRPRSPHEQALRVVLDTSFAGVNPTGVGLYSRQLAAHLARLAAARRLELRCYGPACAAERAPSTLVGHLQELPFYTQAILPVRLMTSRPSIVHSTSHLGPVLAPGKLVITVHDLIFMRYPGDYDPGWLAITRWLLPLVLKRANAIIADSRTTRSDLYRFFKVPPARVDVVYPGTNDEYRLGGSPTEGERDLRSRFRLDSEPYILCMGPWVRRKNLGVVLAAFSRLAHRTPRVNLVVTGATARGMKGPSPEQLTARMPREVSERIRLTGFLAEAELRTLLRGAAVLAYPSRFEGFGLPPLEAMAAGVPVVAANTPAVVEVTGGAALIASTSAPEEWADAFQRVLTDPQLADELREAGLRRSAEFSWETCARKTIDIYDRIAGRASSLPPTLPM